jgi:16S rRNA processing protein RimM
MEGYFQLGFLRKKHGYKGEVILHIESDHPARYASLDVLFLEESGAPIPYFISSIRSHITAEFIVRLEDVVEEAQVDAVVGRTVYLPDDALPELDDTASDPAIEGQLMVEEVMDRPGQPLLVLRHPSKEELILIPLVEAFVLEVNKAEKHIRLEAPPELYTL